MVAETALSRPPLRVDRPRLDGGPEPPRQWPGGPRGRVLVLASDRPGGQAALQWVAERNTAGALSVTLVACAHRPRIHDFARGTAVGAGFVWEEAVDDALQRLVAELAADRAGVLVTDVQIKHGRFDDTIVALTKTQTFGLVVVGVPRDRPGRRNAERLIRSRLRKRLEIVLIAPQAR